MRRTAMAVAAGACGLVAIAGVAVSQGATPSALMQRFVMVPRCAPSALCGEEIRGRWLNVGGVGRQQLNFIEGPLGDYPNQYEVCRPPGARASSAPSCRS